MHKTVKVGCVALLWLLAGCDNYKEQCHAFTLTMIDADNSLHEAKAAADRGDEAALSSAKAALESALSAMGAVDLSGDSMRHTMVQQAQQEYPPSARAAVTALEQGGSMDALAEPLAIGSVWRDGSACN